MNKDHIVILKKIPVDPKHVGALRIHKDVYGEERRHHAHEDHDHREATSSPFMYRAFSFLLFSAFLVNPIGVAYAEEVTPLPEILPPSETTESETPSSPEPEVTMVIPPSEESVTRRDDLPPTEEIEVPPVLNNEEEVPPTETTGGETEATTTEESALLEEEGSEGAGTSTATSTDPSILDEHSTSTATTTAEEGAITPGGDTEIFATSTATSTDETASTTEEDMTEEREEVVATNLDREQTPEERAAERAVAEAVMREQLKKEVEAEIRSRCVSYGDDGYYCLDEASADRVTSQAPIEQVVSLREGGGDKEIVLIRTLPEGETREFITENDVDDEFPSADGDMRMIVWQSLISGRWQIAYKEGTSTVEYLTANPDGNGHPATDGKRIVWQGWSGSHWDIFLAEPGTSEVSFAATTGALAGIHPGWRVTQLSTSLSHDMFPKIAGNFVTWQEHRGDGWVIVVHDLFTGQSRTIEGSLGGTGEAPTIALIFKERTKEGRVFIRASDLATGQRIPLRDDEIPPPAKLPIPEQSGALPIQSGTSSTTTTRSEGDGDAGGTPVI